MALDQLWVKRVESDTPAGLATAVETLLNVTYDVKIVTKFFPMFDSIRSDDQHRAMCVIFYGTPR